MEVPSETLAETRAKRVAPGPGMRRAPRGAPVRSAPPTLGERVELALERAGHHLFAIQHPDAHWCAELESNSTITSQYVYLCLMLGIEIPAAKRASILRYLRGQQKKDGSWGIADLYAGDVSTTAETYLAQRILGVPVDDPGLRAAERYIRMRGGLEKVRILTRIYFAFFGLIPWDAIPAIPPEFIFLPSQVAANVYSLSSWARGTMVPLFIIAHHRPVFALPNGESPENDYLDHLWLDPSDKKIPYTASWMSTLRRDGVSWRAFFTAADGFLKIYEKGKVRRLRQMALRKCEAWILERQEESGDWAGIFPPMLNGIIALTLQGYGLESDPVRKGLEAIERFVWEDARGLRVQACVSPVWDTALGAIGLIDGGFDPQDARLARAMAWIDGKQIRAEYGDWKVYNPHGRPGGWSFEYENTWYPDCDDTAAVVLALLKQDPESASGETVQRAIDWMLSMQNRDGGWAAFDVNNDRTFLNQIPFSDMDSLCDVSSPDVAGRVVEAFGFFQEIARKLPGCRVPAGLDGSISRGLAYLKNSQETEGAWFGRWGVNYIYGTSNVLCGLARAGVVGTEPMVDRAIHWLKCVQNADGGWGECLESYVDKRWMGKGDSTASQTAWALMGLLAYVPLDDPAIEAGVRWLVERQVRAEEPDFARHVFRPGPDGISVAALAAKAKGYTWREAQFTGTGFPQHFFLRYHLYRHYFPMMALGRYQQALRS